MGSSSSTATETAIAAPPAVQVWGLQAGLPVTQASGCRGGLAGATIRRFRLRLTAAGVQRLLAPVGLEIRLVADGAALEMTVAGFRVRVDVSGSRTSQGRLRVEATSLRVGGWLPVPAQLVALALGRLEGKPGLYVVGSQALELDLGAALEHLFRQWDVRVDAPIRVLTITREYLEVECRSGDDEPTRTA
jgi:hypothetical protein